MGTTRELGGPGWSVRHSPVARYSSPPSPRHPSPIAPRRRGAATRAAAGEGLGTVHFPTSCRPEVAPRFDRAVALLHSFEFGAAIRGFDAVLAADPTCAMAHWGLALSRWTNPTSPTGRPPALLARGRQAADAAGRLAAAATDRERGYIAAVARLYEGYERVDQRTRVLAYERAMADLVARHHADTEARIFHALSLVAAAAPTDTSYARQRRGGDHAFHAVRPGPAARTGAAAPAGGRRRASLTRPTAS